ncbi:MAG: hypothetical protein KDK91_04540 [Gammaproteobacteria bacterium]|nr:hypothetical protein [Gammaproteobacteria bacterium]
MNVRGNLIDRHLIRAGWLVVGVSLFGLIGSPTLTAFALSAAAACLLAGYHLRSKRLRADAVIDLIRAGQRATRDELAGALGLSEEEVMRTLRYINRNRHGRRPMFLVWEPQTDRVLDRLAPESQVVLVEHCPSCGAQINQAVRLDEPDPPRCGFCAQPVGGARLDALRSEYRSRLTALEDTREPFKPWLFIVLLLIFWPAALAYALYKSGLLDPWLERLRTALPH